MKADEEAEPKEDSQLLREYVATHSERAFAQLVQRHIGLVYSAALRQVDGDAHLAQDIAQSVFIDLSRKSARLRGHTSLTGWLYTSVRYAAATVRRSNQRRERREREAHRMNEPIHEPAAADWETLQPILDEALHQLGTEDRNAILLRFLEGKTLAEVGRGLGLNENAARKRVERALEKLRNFFGQRGITVSAMALAETLNAKALVAVPPGVANAVTAASLATAPAILPPLKIMAITKTQIAAGAIMAAMAAAIVVQTQTATRLKHENDVLRRQSAQLDELRAENERLAKPPVPSANAAGADQLRDLARLRAEVSRLKNQLATAAKNARDEKKSGQAQSEPGAAEQEKQLALARLGNAKLLMLPMIMYAQAHQGQFPTNLADLDLDHSPMEDDIPDGWKDIKQATNQFEIVYKGAIDAITNPASVIVVREIEPQQASGGNWLRSYGFADGHSELHNAADGNFAPWEQQHIQNSQ